jgi:predicted dithiol-disulfide oxidoreductase (DUF899 family)
MASPLHPNRFPGESPSYREARNQLLEAEMTLRKNIEEVATLRRKLPLGGEVSEDYIFDEGATDLADSATVRQTRLSELFQPDKDALAIYSFMYGPRMKAAIRVHARTRGWDNLRLLSSAGNTYNHDYHGETVAGDQQPGLNVFARSNGKIHHFYYTELRFVPAEAGQHHRAVDLLWPLWNLFDFTPEGRGTNWGPKLVYP